MTAPDDVAPHDETCARRHRRICVCMYDKAPVEERCGCFEPGCPTCTEPAADRQVDPDAPGWASARDTVATGDRVVDEERCGVRAPSSDLGYAPCDLRADHGGPHSARGETWPAARPAVADAVMADLGAAITEGVTEALIGEEWLARADRGSLIAECRRLSEAAQYNLRRAWKAERALERVEALLTHPAHLDSYLEATFRAALRGEE